MKHELPKLPWQADALTGAISATTIDFHVQEAYAHIS